MQSPWAASLKDPRHRVRLVGKLEDEESHGSIVSPPRGFEVKFNLRSPLLQHFQGWGFIEGCFSQVVPRCGPTAGLSDLNPSDFPASRRSIDLCDLCG